MTFEREYGRAVTVLPDSLRADITDLKSAKAWIQALYDAGLPFHFEDSPESIVNLDPPRYTFKRKDCPLLRDRVNKLYSFKWPKRYDCPIGYLLHIDGLKTGNGYWKA